HTNERSALFASVQSQSQQTAHQAHIIPAHTHVINTRSITHAPDGTPLTYRLYDVLHTTEYTYAQAVEHSTHIFRLLPVEGQVQEVIHSTLSLSVEGESVRFEDVF